MRCSDVLAPSRRASFGFAWRYHDVRLRFAHAGPVRRILASREFVSRAPLPAMRRGEVRTSQVPRQPLWTYAVFFDPGRTGRPSP